MRCVPDNGEFSRPEDPRGADGLDVGALLEDLWNDWVSWPDEDDPDYTERRAPFTLKWPGLAAPEHAPLAPAEREQALEVVLPRIRKRHSAGLWRIIRFRGTERLRPD
jgi:hypothetical protein